MNILIKNITALLCHTDQSGEYYTKACDITLSDGKITSITDPQDPSTDPQDPQNTRIIDGTGRFAIPALVNAHTHAYMTVLRGIADDLPFSDWLFGRVMPLEEAMSREDAYWSIMLGCMEMIRSGTGTFCDMHMFPGLIGEVLEELGMRAAVSRGLTDAFGEDKKGGERRLNEALEEYSAFSHNPRLRFFLAPHALYTCSEAYLRTVLDSARQNALPINIHVAESHFETQFAYEKWGKTPIAYLEDIGLLDHGALLAHCVNLTDDDIDRLSAISSASNPSNPSNPSTPSKSSVFVALNPKSNLKLGNGTAKLPALLQKNIPCCIGTDSAASNNTQNVFSEMNYTALLHKGSCGDASVLPARAVIKMATQNGAAALGFNGGRIEVGADADIAILSLSHPHLQPKNDLVSALCYSVNGSETETLIIDGKIIMENRQISGIDQEKVYYHTNKTIERIKNNAV